MLSSFPPCSTCPPVKPYSACPVFPPCSSVFLPVFPVFPVFPVPCSCPNKLQQKISVFLLNHTDSLLWENVHDEFFTFCFFFFFLVLTFLPVKPFSYSHMYHHSFLSAVLFFSSFCVCLMLGYIGILLICLSSVPLSP